MTKCYICGKELKKNNYMVCTSVLTNFDQKPPVENICYSCFKKLNFKIILVNTTETNFFKKEFRKKKKKVKKMANLYKMAEKYRFDVPKSGHFVIEKKDANKGQKKRGDKK